MLRDHVHALGFRRVDVLAHRDNRASHRVAEAAALRREPGLVTVARLGGGAVLSASSRS